jgi:hypothetical protein
MKRKTAAILIAAATLCLAAPAHAQRSGPDYDYCLKLIDIYDRYIGSDELGPRQGAAGTDLDGRVAVAKCRQGETSVGIPILERKLRANGFTLPKR